MPVWCLALLAGGGHVAPGQTPDHGLALPEPGSATTQFPDDPRLLGDWGGRRDRWAEAGFTFEIAYVGEFLANVSGGMDQGAIYEGLLASAVDLDLGRLAADRLGTFHVSALYPHGKSLTENYVGDLFVLSNIDAPDQVRLFELWYEQPFWDGRVTLRAGKLAADEEFAGTERGCLFIDGTCGWPGFLGVNVPAPAYPVGAVAARLAVSITDRWTFRTGFYDGDPYPVDETGEAEDPNGINFEWGPDTLWLTETSLAWTLGRPESPLPGIARLGGWYHSGDFSDLCFDETGFCLADPRSTGIPRPIEGAWGLYLAAEHQLWNEPGTEPDSGEGLGLFTRVAGCPEDRDLLEFYAEAGLHWVGLLPGRSSDACGMAVVYGRISDSLRQLVREGNALTGASLPIPDHEMVLEFTYRAELRNGWSAQPIVQYIVHPGGSSAIDDALVIGIRTNLDF